MGRYVVRRLLWMVVLFFVSVITFLLAFAVPGDPAKSIAGVHATLEILDRIRAELNLDEPIYVQYGTYIANLAQGDMDYSYETQLPVWTAIQQRFPATVMVVMFGILFELLIGIPVSMISALRQYGFRDRLFTVLSLLGIAAPGFFLGLILMYFFAYQIPIFPLGGCEGWTIPGLWYGVLPGLTIGLGGGAWYSRMLRSSMLDILGADFVKATRAEGLPERTVVWRHIMRNAWSTIVTLLGIDISWFLGGVLVIEVVFGIPGIGQPGIERDPDPGHSDDHGHGPLRRHARRDQQLRGRPRLRLARPAREVQLTSALRAPSFPRRLVDHGAPPGAPSGGVGGAAMAWSPPGRSPLGGGNAARRRATVRDARTGHETRRSKHYYVPAERHRAKRDAAPSRPHEGGTPRGGDTSWLNTIH